MGETAKTPKSPPKTHCLLGTPGALAVEPVCGPRTDPGFQTRFRGHEGLLVALGAFCAVLGSGCHEPLTRTNAVAALDGGADAGSDADAGPDGDAGCSAGYQDNDGDGTCLPDCETAGLACMGHAHCDDGQGAVVCVCDAGYQDNDSNGSCLPSCDAAALDCRPNSHCSDAAGPAQCVCDDGFQDNDGDGACLPSCAGAGETCGGHGTCDDSSGEATCACSSEYAGKHCTDCAIGYQDIRARNNSQCRYRLGC